MVQRIKLNFNSLLRQIDDTLGADEIETVHNNAFGIGVGLELLQGYVRSIAEHAIETEDDFLIQWCKDLCVVKEYPEEKSAE